MVSDKNPTSLLIWLKVFKQAREPFGSFVKLRDDSQAQQPQGTYGLSACGMQSYFWQEEWIIKKYVLMTGGNAPDLDVYLFLAVEIGFYEKASIAYIYKGNRFDKVFSSE